MERIGTQDILTAVADGTLADWRKLAQPLAARYRAADAPAAAAFAAAVTAAAEAAHHTVHEIRLGGGHVDVALCTVDEGTGARWVTTADLELARAVSALARERGLAAVPGEVTQVELALDAAAAPALAPFWSALLSGEARPLVTDTVFDPANRVPPVWFQDTDPHTAPRQRWHLDVWLAPEVADARIAAAVAAGGTVVDDAGAPSFTVLADPEGNRACVCTALLRE
ncbi:VOC family protein [Streptomyces sp. NPDC050560]|uniref:VOC family protein n=1 Tax=Streptomyces sp. NPDC050560 TaxID=3365630 RepID=UPI0037A3F0F2